MPEPCSALDPTSTRVIEGAMTELVEEATIITVTHHMTLAARASDTRAFAFHGTPGVIVEHGDTETMFSRAQGERTADVVSGCLG